MRKSLLTVSVVVALTSGAASGLTAENTQQQRVEHYAPMLNDLSGVAAEGTFLSFSLSNAELPHCTAGSAKDVGLDKNKCAPNPR
jgi:hypothetical protein